MQSTSDRIWPDTRAIAPGNLSAPVKAAEVRVYVGRGSVALGLGDDRLAGMEPTVARLLAHQLAVAADRAEALAREPA